MTISQPSTYKRKAGCLPQRPQDHHRTGKRPSPDSGDSRTPQAALPVSQPDVVGTELGHRQGLPGPGLPRPDRQASWPAATQRVILWRPAHHGDHPGKWSGRRAAAARRYRSAEGTSSRRSSWARTPPARTTARSPKP